MRKVWPKGRTNGMVYAEAMSNGASHRPLWHEDDKPRRRSLIGLHQEEYRRGTPADGQREPAEGAAYL